MCQIALGLALIAVGGPFMTLFGSSFVMQGIGDVIGTIKSVALNQPIPVGDYFKAKAIGLAISLAVASIGAFGQVMKWWKPILNIGNPVGEFLPMAIGKVSFITAVSEGIAYAGRKMVKSNDGALERMVREELNDFMRINEQTLDQIFTSDALTAETALLNAAVRAANKHTDKFHGTGVTVAKGIGLGMLGLPRELGLGTSIAANIAVNAAIGINEASQSTEYVLDKVSDALPSQMAGRQNSFQMMQQALTQSYPADALQIMATLQSTNFASATGIDFAHCTRIGALPLGSFTSKSAGIQSACNSVAATFNAASAVTSNFRSALYKILLDHLHGIISADFVQPIADSVGQIVWEPFEQLEKARRAAVREANEWKNPDEQRTSPDHSDDHVATALKPLKNSLETHKFIKEHGDALNAVGKAMDADKDIAQHLGPGLEARRIAVAFVAHGLQKQHPDLPIKQAMDIALEHVLIAEQNLPPQMIKVNAAIAIPARWLITSALGAIMASMPGTLQQIQSLIKETVASIHYSHIFEYKGGGYTVTFNKPKVGAGGNAAMPDPDENHDYNEHKEPRKEWQLERYDEVKYSDKFKAKYYRDPKTKLWWTKDHAHHSRIQGEPTWKVYEKTKNGLRWYKDADKYGQFIEGKHKGTVGDFIPFKELRGVHIKK